VAVMSSPYFDTLIESGNGSARDKDRRAQEELVFLFGAGR
jgi:hypothetical protein